MRKSLLARIGEFTREELEHEILSFDDPEVSHGGTESKSTKKKKTYSSEDRRIVEELQKSLGTKIQISRKKGKKGQGRLSIEFYSNDELKDLFRRLI